MAKHTVDVSLTGQFTNQTVALILAGGRGSRLFGLTDHRAKPAVYFGGRFRIIDFALSNCINSGLNRIGVITQYKAHSLLRHIQRGWSFMNLERNQFIDMLPARQQLEEAHWYRGTADAVYQNLGLIRHHYSPKYIVILAGDHVYKMNYANMLLDHIESGGECTIGCIEVPRSMAHAFGVMEVDPNFKIIEFVEKPTQPPTLPDNINMSLASMGIYIFNADYLYKLLENDTTNPSYSFDFGNDLIPHMVNEGVVYAHPFSRSCMSKDTNNEDYWRDVGTIDSYWEANMDLVSEHPQLNIDDDTWPIRSCSEQLNPTRFIQDDSNGECVVKNSLIASGSMIKNALLVKSILFSKVAIESGTRIESSVILPEVTVGKGCRLKHCVVDRCCVIPDGMVIGEDVALDAQRFYCSPNGVILVTPPMLKALQKAVKNSLVAVAQTN